MTTWERDILLESQADAALYRYLDSIEDGLQRREKEEPFYANEE